MYLFMFAIHRNRYFHQIISAKSIAVTIISSYAETMKDRMRTGRHRSTRSSEPEQLPLWKARRGKRRGAGRKPKGRRAGSPHKERPELAARHPVHVVLRVIAAVRNLRRRFTYKAIRRSHAHHRTARR